MTKFHFTLAAAAALLTAAGISAPAFAQTSPSNNLATLDAPTLSSTLRKIDLQAEPIQQSQELTAPDSQPTYLNEPAVDTAPPQNAGAATEAPAATTATTADATQPQSARRLCKKFSAAIAMVIDVPCE